MRRFFSFLSLFSWAYCNNDSCTNITQLNKAQIQTIRYAYHYGEKYDFGYTMAAIAWKESCAGLYRINFDDPSAGIYHAHIPGVIKRHYKTKNTSFKRNVIAEKLIRDPEFASKIALEELLYWKKVRKGNWKEIIKSYNKGFSWEKSKGRNELAEAYYKDISQRVNVLKDYFEQNKTLQIAPRSFKKPTFTQNSTEIRLLSE